MADTIDIGKMADAMAEILADFKDVTDETLQAAAKTTTAETVAKLQQDPTPDGDSKNPYRKSWKVKMSVNKQTGKVEAVVYSTQPQLTHLLEYGHLKVGKKGGRTKAIPHIKPAEQFAISRFEQLIREGMNK